MAERKHTKTNIFGIDEDLQAQNRTSLIPSPSRPTMSMYSSTTTQPRHDPDNSRRLINHYARAMENFILRTLECPTFTTTHMTGTPLHHFIAHVLRSVLRVQNIHWDSCCFALILIGRLKRRLKLHDTSISTSSHLLFVTAFMLADKVWQDPERNIPQQWWASFTMGHATSRQLGQLERWMCKVLDWNFKVDKASIQRLRVALVDYNPGDTLASHVPWNGIPRTWSSRNQVRQWRPTTVPGSWDSPWVVVHK